MQSPILRPSLQWRCLLLVLMAIPVAATPEEGTVLWNWLHNMIDASNELASWKNNSTNPCGTNADWYGDSYENNILIVDLGGTQLIGSLVPELGQLLHLASLQLSYNGFSGSFKNVLNGPIPTSLGKLTSLKFFYSNISEPYPESLTSFPFFSAIDLESNLISRVLNISQILEFLSATGANNNLLYMVQSVSLKNNNISNVTVAIGSLQIPPTIAFKLLENLYCIGSINLYDEHRRCLCQQDFICSLPNYLKSPFIGISPSFGSHTIFNGMIIRIICGIIFLLAIFIGVIKTKLARHKLSKLDDVYKQSVHDTRGIQFKSLSLLQHGNMDAKFSDALCIIYNVKALDKRCFHINKHQCMRLVDFYIKVGEFFESTRDACKSFPVNKAMFSLDATISVLQKGQVLLTKYTKDDWHIIVMTGGVNQGSFDAIHLELEACIQSICEFIEEKIPQIKSFPFMKQGYLGTPLLLLAKCDRATILREDADRDKKEMLAKVESTRQEINNTRSLTNEARSSKIVLMEIASQSLQDEKPISTASTKLEELPTILYINPFHIELGEPLGSGGTAEVLKCRWSKVNCAIKILRRGDVNGLRAEVGKLMELRHPNIVTLFGFSVGKGSHKGRPMVIMELLNGDLSLLQCQLKFNLNKAVDVMHKIATGMAYLHSRGIFHGDLKSMNVLVNNLTSLFEVKISDCGVSQHIHQYATNHDTNDSNIGAINTKSLNGRVGTPMWMAPEVLTSSGLSSGDGNNMYSAKFDVYSFSMVCVETLTGKMPYNQSLVKIKDVRAYVVDEDKRPTVPLSLPSDLRELIGQCWDKDPELRPNFHQIWTRLQKLQAHSSPLQKRGWKLALCSKKLCKLDCFLDN